MRDRGQGLEEVLGYPFKIQDLTKMPGDEVCRLLAVTKGRHLAQLCRPWSRRMVELEGQIDPMAGCEHDAEGRLQLYGGELAKQVTAGGRVAFELLVQVVQVLSQNRVTGGVARRLTFFLRTVAEEHGWAMTDLGVKPEVGPWLEP